MILFKCPRCLKVGEASDDMAGIIVTCPDCQQMMMIPTRAGVNSQLMGKKPKQRAATDGAAAKPAPTEATAKSQYYYLKNKKQQGPVSATRLRDLASNGRLAGTDLIWKQGWTHWRPARKARGLFASPATQPAPAGRVGKAKAAPPTDKHAEQNAGASLPHLERATAHAEKGNYHKALDELALALRLDPKNAHAYATRGLIYAKLKGDYREALADFAEAVRFAPTDPVLYELRAVLYHEMGNSAKARADEEKAARLRPPPTSEVDDSP